MTQFLPPNLLVLFAPRDPIPFLPPPDKLPHEKKTRGYTGITDFLNYFEDPKDTPPPLRVENREERLERRRRERAEQVAYKLEQEIAVWDPSSSAQATTDPFKTLFVARINYDSSESKLRREFEVYGPIRKIVMVHNTINGKPRGYAFVEYEHERDMHSAYKHADGKKIDGRRVLVDVERARTVKGWLPRHLGGGLGGTRRGGPELNVKHSGREDNERERERYRLETEREAARGAGGAGARPPRDGRDRERPERRSRSRERERERPDRKRRSRSRSAGREKKRRRSRERVKDPDIEEIEERPRDRDRKRRRSRSRDKDKERERRRRERREKRDKEDRERGITRDDDQDEIRIKEEPMDDYPDYNQEYNLAMDASIKFEEAEKMVKKQERDRELGSNNGAGNDDNDDDEY